MNTLSGSLRFRLFRARSGTFFFWRQLAFCSQFCKSVVSGFWALPEKFRKSRAYEYLCGNVVVPFVLFRTSPDTEVGQQDAIVIDKGNVMRPSTLHHRCLQFVGNLLRKFLG